MIKVHAFRLTHGSDLKLEIEKYVKNNNIKSGVVVSGVGSLQEAVIRNATASSDITLKEDLEIISLNGTVSLDGVHLHIGVSDSNLKTYGGHLKMGSLVNTTTELVILEFLDYEFKRQMDIETGYKELQIKKLAK